MEDNRGGAKYTNQAPASSDEEAVESGTDSQWEDEEVVESDTDSEWEDEEDGGKRGDKITFKRIEVPSAQLTSRQSQLSLKFNSPDPQTTVNRQTACRQASQPLKQPTSDAAPNIASDQSVDAITIAGPKATRREMVKQELTGSLRRAILDERKKNPIATSTYKSSTPEASDTVTAITAITEQHVSWPVARKDGPTANIWREIASRNDPNTAGW
jgi:hypothetical protein